MPLTLENSYRGNWMATWRMPNREGAKPLYSPRIPSSFEILRIRGTRTTPEWCEVPAHTCHCAAPPVCSCALRHRHTQGALEASPLLSRSCSIAIQKQEQGAGFSGASTCAVSPHACILGACLHLCNTEASMHAAGLHLYITGASMHAASPHAYITGASMHAASLRPCRANKL